MKKLLLFGLVFLAVALLASPALGAADTRGKDQGLAALRQFNDEAKSADGDSFFDIYFVADTPFKEGTETDSHQAEMIALRLAKSDNWKEFTPVEQQLKSDGRMNKAQLIDSIAKDAKLTKADSKKVVRFKAGSDLAHHVKSAEVYESGGWMKIMKKSKPAGAATGETTHGALAIRKGVDGLDPETEIIECAQDGEDVSIWGRGQPHYSKRKGWDLDGKGTDNVVEEIELAIETLRLKGTITDAEAENAMAALEERKVIWQHKEQNTESEADWLDK